MCCRPREETGVQFIKRPDGSISVSKPLLAAAAVLPLMLRDSDVWFDVPTLLKRARQLEPEFEGED